MVALVSFTTFAFAGGDQNQNRHDGAIGQGFIQQERESNPNKDALKVIQLTEEQKAIIYEIYEEEKLARDVYRTLGDVYPEENTFANIQLSEQTHMDAVENLCDRYPSCLQDCLFVGQTLTKKSQKSYKKRASVRFTLDFQVL